MDAPAIAKASKEGAQSAGIHTDTAATSSGPPPVQFVPPNP